MSGTLTPYGRQQLLVARFMPDVDDPPAGLWLTYTRDVPTSNADGSELDEPTTGGFDRVAVGALSSDNWNLTDFGEVYNVNVLTFPAPTAFWGLLTGWALVDTSVIGTGNCWAVGSQVEPFQVDDGDDAPTVDVAQLVVGLYD